MNEQHLQLLLEAKHNRKENEEYLKSLSKIKTDMLNPVLQEIHAEVFQRTDCLSCANCCRTTPALVTGEDVRRIARHLHITPKQFIRHYVLVDYYGEMTLNGVPCRFLNEDNSCAIYEARPEACRRYPHTDETGYNKRPSLNLANTMVCPAAFQILNNLKKYFPKHDI